MKALILAAGKGQRIRPLTDEVNKCMLLLNGKPILEHVINRCCQVPLIDEILIVVGYRAEDIINHFGISYYGTKISYIIQREQKGLVDAILCAKSMVKESDFFLLLGDEIVIGSDYEKFISEAIKKQNICTIGVASVSDISRIKKTYTLLHDESRRVFRLIEKPSRPLNNLIGTGHVLFKNAIFDYIESVLVNPVRGEKELPDLIQAAIDAGEKVYYSCLCSHYINVNELVDLKLVEELLISDQLNRIQEDCTTLANIRYRCQRDK